VWPRAPACVHRLPPGAARPAPSGLPASRRRTRLDAPCAQPDDTSDSFPAAGPSSGPCSSPQPPLRAAVWPWPKLAYPPLRDLGEFTPAGQPLTSRALVSSPAAWARPSRPCPCALGEFLRREPPAMAGFLTRLRRRKRPLCNRSCVCERRRSKLSSGPHSAWTLSCARLAAKSLQDGAHRMHACRSKALASHVGILVSSTRPIKGNRYTHPTHSDLLRPRPHCSLCGLFFSGYKIMSRRQRKSAKC
jgi:hypothetical protein